MAKCLSVSLVVMCIWVSGLNGSFVKESLNIKNNLKGAVKFRSTNNEPLFHAFQENKGHSDFESLILKRNEVKSTVSSVNYTIFVDFYLFRKKNKDIVVTKLFMDAKKILDAGFQKLLDTKIVIHGYKNNLQSDIVQQTSRTFALNSDVNMIAVDWGRIAGSMLYPRAVNHVPGVGEHVGNFLAILFKTLSVKPENVHIVGHSLGAHVASYAGKTVNKEGWSIGRITGLDPAGPLFQDTNNGLAKNDAKLVDVIHTCMKYLGITGKIGHVDFYPNGGMAIQPGCNLDFSGICSHSRAYEFFVESIKRPKAFIGKYCKDWRDLDVCDNKTTAVMGASLSYQAEGAYYLKTSSSSPFGLGENSIIF